METKIIINTFDAQPLKQDILQVLNSRKTEFERGGFNKKIKEEQKQREENAKKHEEIMQQQKKFSKLNNNSKDFYLRSEVAEILKLTLKQLEDKVKSGEIKTTIQGDTMYIAKEELQKQITNK